MKFPIKIVRKNKEVRAQGSLMPMETKKTGAYISNVIKHKYYDYYNIDHRVAVCKIDAVAGKLTYKWADRATAKTFKFYTSHEIDAEEIMQDIRAKWVDLNCNEIFKKSIPLIVRDGYILFIPKLTKDTIKYDLYSEFESPPGLWIRGDDNKILGYKVQFTPKPRGVGSSAAMLHMSTSTVDNLKMVNKTLTSKEVIHIEYGQPNYGCGTPIIESAWDCIIKLAGESHQDMLDRRSIPTLHLTEDEQDDENTKARQMLKMVANSDQDTARVWYHKKDHKGEILDYPMFAYESPTSNKNYSRGAQQIGVSTGDYGNVSKEWTRLTTITGHSINWFMGNRAGATVGSETDKLSDDEQETIDFGLLEGIIRKILDWLDAQGIITMPKESFVIKYWKDWERIELKEKNKEDILEKGILEHPTSDKDPDTDQQDNEPKENKINSAIIKEIIACIKKNMSYAMTDVSSSWIDQIGYDDRSDRLFMVTLSGVVYSKPAPMGEWSFEDWETAGSKGRYFWDYLSQRDPPWQRDTIPSHLLLHFVSDLPKENFIKVPILDYPLINSLDTEGKIKKLGLKNEWSMGTTTATKIKRMLESLKDTANKHQLRVNTMTAEAFGNSIKENHPLLYDIGEGVIVEEFICPDSWQKNIGKIVPLGVYHNVEQNNTPELPKWQIVGTAEIFGWDELDGSDYVKYNYDYDKIAAVFNKLNQFNWLTPALKEYGTSDISTAYYCDIDFQWNEKLQRIIRVQTNIELISISFVPQGNCPGEICSIKVIKKNINEMQAYIRKCLDEGIKKEVCLAKAYTKFKAKS